MKLGMPDGTSTMFGDDRQGNPGDLWRNLRRWAQRYDRPDFLYVATEGMEGIEPSETAFAYPVSGLYSMRSGWNRDAIFFALKNGPDGGGHCQRDNGTFELYAGGRSLMPDSGAYIYDGDPEGRAWFRQTKVHQTMTLNGLITQYAPKLLQWQPGDDLDILVVENASYTNLTHRRAVFFVDKEYFVIVDEAIGRGSGNVNLHFQLAPTEADLNFSALTSSTLFDEGWNVMVKNVYCSLPIEMIEEEGQVSFVYGVKEDRPAFAYRVRKPASQRVRFVTLVVPYNGINPPEIEAELIGNPAIGATAVNLNVTANGVSRQIGYSFQ